MQFGSILIAVVFALSLSGVAAGASGGDAKYVGAVKCKSCHKKDLIGNQYGEWTKGKHSKAFDTLKSDKAVKIAKEKGIAGPPHESGECLKCHSTAYGLEESQFDKKPLKIQDGIQCESCHGPGSKYRKKKVMSDHDKAIAAGMWDPKKDEKICQKCHNDESPTWDVAKGFDWKASREKIRHAIPEDVKGKYLEVEKERRKAGGGQDDEDEEDDE